MSRFHGRQSAPGSPKIRGNKGVMRAFREAMRELAEERNKNTPVERTKAYRKGLVALEGDSATQTSPKDSSQSKRTRRRKKKAGVDDMAALLAEKFNSPERSKFTVGELREKG